MTADEGGRLTPRRAGVSSDPSYTLSGGDSSLVGRQGSPDPEPCRVVRGRRLALQWDCLGPSDAARLEVRSCWTLEDREILVTGATGYVGGRLVPCLLEAGRRPRVLVRDERRLGGRQWASQVEAVQGDVLDAESLDAALSGIHTAYYLIHSMSTSGDFRERDRRAAANFGAAAAERGVRQIIYLGGLGDPGSDLSKHLRSRQETGQALRAAGVPVTELRAAIVVGSGSVSFEMIRYLTERLPVMICPKWVYTKAQPIGIDDVLAYLMAAPGSQEARGQTIEIGGLDVLTYGKMMLEYADVRGLSRVLIPVPVLTPRLSSYWVHWVTPIPAQIARPLIQGLRNEVVVRDDKARRLFPDIVPLGYRRAVALALANLEKGIIETSWSDALSSSQPGPPEVILSTQEGLIEEVRHQVVEAPSKDVWDAFTRVGGTHGWPYMSWAWRLRGVFDRLIGGVGLRRGRRHPVEARIGDALDFWRVEDVAAGRLLRLKAEMKLPGTAWLEFRAEALNEHRTRLVQTARFAPRGLLGLIYWYTLYPAHALIFSGMIRELAGRAQARASAERANAEPAE